MMCSYSLHRLSIFPFQYVDKFTMENIEIEQRAQDHQFVKYI